MLDKVRVVVRNSTRLGSYGELGLRVMGSGSSFWRVTTRT